MEVLGHPAGSCYAKCNPNSSDWCLPTDVTEDWLKPSVGTNSPGLGAGTSDSQSPSNSREDLLSPLTEVVEHGAADSEFTNTTAPTRCFYSWPASGTGMYPPTGLENWATVPVKTEGAAEGVHQQRTGFTQQPQVVPSMGFQYCGESLGQQTAAAQLASATEKNEMWKQQQLEASLWPWSKLDQYGMPVPAAGAYPFPQHNPNFGMLPPHNFPGLPPNLLFAANQQLQLQQRHQQLQQQYQNQIKEENCDILSAVAERNHQARLGEQLAAYSGQVQGIPVDMFRHPMNVPIASGTPAGPVCAMGEPAAGTPATDKTAAQQQTGSPAACPVPGAIARFSSGIIPQTRCEPAPLARSKSEPGPMQIPIVQASPLLLARIRRIGNLTAEERLSKILRYRQKRIERNFKHTIKYQCRKALADTRPRVRGRFARNDDPASVPPGQTKKALKKQQSHNLDAAIAAGLKAEAERMSIQGDDCGLELAARSEYDEMLDELQDQEAYGSFDEHDNATDLSDENIMSIVFEDEMPGMNSFLGSYSNYNSGFMGMVDAGDLLTNSLLDDVCN